MLTSTIHKNFKISLDKNADASAFGGCPAFLPVEADYILNQAYLQELSQKFTGNVNTGLIGFEGSAKRTSDLENLVKTEKITSAQLDSSSNVLKFPNLFKNTEGKHTRLFFVSAVLHFGNKSVTCTLIDHTSANKFLKTYNNDPWINNPVAAIEDNTLLVYIDTHNMVAPYTMDLTYIKVPQVIDSSTPTADINEVPDNVMYEIINRAAVIALENIESRRTESKLQINTLQE